MAAIISAIISLISSRNSILDSEIASRYSLSLRVIMLKNKDLRDIGELDIKAVKFVWRGIKLSARDWIWLIS